MENHEAVVKFAARGCGQQGSPPVNAPLSDPNAKPGMQYVDAVDAGQSLIQCSPVLPAVAADEAIGFCLCMLYCTSSTQRINRHDLHQYTYKPCCSCFRRCCATVLPVWVQHPKRAIMTHLKCHVVADCHMSTNRGVDCGSRPCRMPKQHANVTASGGCICRFEACCNSPARWTTSSS